MHREEALACVGVKHRLRGPKALKRLVELAGLQ